MNVTGLIQKVNAELSKVKLHAKSKIASLTSQLSQSKKVAGDTVEQVIVSFLHLFFIFLNRSVLHSVLLIDSNTGHEVCMHMNCIPLPAPPF